MKTMIISFYADLNNTYYSDKAKILIEKCKNFNINYDITELKSKGSYMLNCLLKPEFIKTMMNKHNKSLIWIDCDTDLRTPFDHFDDIEEDIGFATHTGDIQGIKASPIYFKNGKNFNLIIDNWINDCKEGLLKNKYELDHDALKLVTIPKIKNNISIFLLKNNFIDFCNGKYIQNGNSSFKEKSLIHNQLRNINKKLGRKI
jgi:hypothetical protein